MKKLDPFFITVFSLVLVLTGIYYYTYQQTKWLESNSAIRTKVQREKGLVKLNKRLEEISKESKLQSRTIASISPDPIESEFISESHILLDESAKKYYIEAKSKCYELNKELDCMKIVEKAVTHFPDSEWTGETLVLLTEFYYRTKRPQHMKDILKVLKKDFANNKSIQDKVGLIERQLR